MGTHPRAADNRWLLDATQRQIPVICFLVASLSRVPAHHPDIHRRLFKKVT